MEVKKKQIVKNVVRKYLYKKMHHVIIHYVMNVERQDEENKWVLLIYIESKLKHL